MPRFDNDEFASNRRSQNDQRDRSVPVDENYYDINSGDMVDINSLINDFESRQNQLERRNREPVKRQTPPPKKKKNKKNRTGLKVLIGLLTPIIAILLVGVIVATSLINSVLNKITYDEKVENQYVTASDLKQEEDVTNVLLLGVDARIIHGEDAKTSRSDSMMIVSIDKKHGCIKTISFLRDSWVYIPCKDSKQRLNAACQYGGYSGVVDTIEYNYGVNIDGYVVVNFSVFQSLVDAVGGVEIEVTEEEAKEVNSHKKRYGNAKLEAGKHKLTGKQALAYCRIRKIDTDFMRAYRQRMVIKSIIDGIKAEPTKIFSIADECAQYIETDLTKDEIKKIAISALSCIKTDMLETRVPFDGTWDYATINGASVIELDSDANKDMLIDYIYNKTADQIQAEEKAKEDAKNKN